MKVDSEALAVLLPLWHGSSWENIRNHHSAHRCELKTSLAFHVADPRASGCSCVCTQHPCFHVSSQLRFYILERSVLTWNWQCSTLPLLEVHFSQFWKFSQDSCKGIQTAQSLTQYWIFSSLPSFFFYYHVFFLSVMALPWRLSAANNS